MDVAYARIHLHPWKKGGRWGENVPVAEGQWYFTLTFSVYGYSNDVVNMLEALCDAGIGVVCNESARLLRMAEETDYVGITPGADKYAHNEKIGNEITLPCVIQYMSDLHMELWDNSRYIKANEFDAVGDVLVLAGDTFYLRDIIAPQKKFWNWASKNFRQVLLVPGNHEFYSNGDVTVRGDSWQWMFRGNVGYYYNKVVRIDDTDFVLTRIRTSTPQLATPESHHTVNLEHEKCLAFLKQAVEESTAKHIVVVTHHLPTLKVVAPQHKGSALNGAFATELGNYIVDSRIDAWIYGHSHTNIDTTIGNTRIVCNQLGYVYYKRVLQRVSYKRI